VRTTATDTHLPPEASTGPAPPPPPSSSPAHPRQPPPTALQDRRIRRRPLRLRPLPFAIVPGMPVPSPILRFPSRGPTRPSPVHRPPSLLAVAPGLPVPTSGLPFPSRAPGRPSPLLRVSQSPPSSSQCPCPDCPSPSRSPRRASPLPRSPRPLLHPPDDRPGRPSPPRPSLNPPVTCRARPGAPGISRCPWHLPRPLAALVCTPVIARSPQVPPPTFPFPSRSGRLPCPLRPPAPHCPPGEPAHVLPVPTLSSEPPNALPRPPSLVPPLTTLLATDGDVQSPRKTRENEPGSGAPTHRLPGASFLCSDLTFADHPTLSRPPRSRRTTTPVLSWSRMAHACTFGDELDGRRRTWIWSETRRASCSSRLRLGHRTGRD
jgi:hypothetical protein